MRACLIMLSVWASVATADVEREGVSFKEEHNVGSAKLVLNGTGLRAVRKFGMSFRVYVAGLYLPEKTKAATDVIHGTGPQVVELVFLRSVDKETLQDGWNKGFKKNCVVECDQMAPFLMAFNDLMVDAEEKSRLRMTLDGATVNVEFIGKEQRAGQVSNAAFRKNFLAIFIGENPPTPELKAGLLGE